MGKQARSDRQPQINPKARSGLPSYQAKIGAGRQNGRAFLAAAGHGDKSADCNNEY